MATLELPQLLIHTVAAVVATERVVVINRNPVPDEQAVPINSTIALEIVDLGTAGIARAQTQVFVDGLLAFEGGATPEFAPGFNGTSSAVTVTADSLQLVIHPTVAFPSLAAVAVRVVSATADGVPLDLSYAFTVEDRTAPRVLAAQAVAQKLVRVAFDEPVVLPDGATLLLTPRGAPAVPVAVTAATVEENVVTLTLNTEMTPDVEYEVVAQGVTDRFGNGALAPYDRVSFVGFRPARPPTRRFELWLMLPKHNRRDDQTGDLRRFIACLQEVVDLLLVDTDRFTDIFDFERAPEAFLDCILLDLGNPFPFELTTLARRRLASILVEMYRQKGTATGIKNAVRFFLGIEVSAILPLNSDALVLGESELGVDWILAPSDRFARYAFDLEVSRVLTDTERKQLRAIVDYLRPAHTHFVTLVEPAAAAPSDSWDLGLSELGISSALS